MAASQSQENAYACTRTHTYTNARPTKSTVRTIINKLPEGQLADQLLSRIGFFAVWEFRVSVSDFMALAPGIAIREEDVVPRAVAVLGNIEGYTVTDTIP